MVTSLVHIGDFHAAPGPRNADRYRALDQIIAEGLRLERLGAWLWPGDLFHARSTIEDRNAIASRLRTMAECAPVLLVYGNHDLPGDLDIFAQLAGRYLIHVFDRPDSLQFELATGQRATVFALPYPTKGGLTALGVAPADVVDTASGALDAIFMQAASALGHARARGELTFAIGHVNVSGSIASTGQPQIGREIEISRAHLARLGPIYIGLNHIHAGQEIAGALYPGSVCRLSWGEIEDKRWLEVGLGDGRWGGFAGDGPWNGDSLGTFDVRAHPVDVAPMYHVEGDLTRTGFTWAVTDGPGGAVQPAPANWRGCEVRVRYRFKQSEKRALADDDVRAPFAEALRFEPEPIAVPDRELRSPEVAAARTLAQKLAAYTQVDALAPSVADKLARLEHGDPLQLLSELQNALAQLEAGEEAPVAA